VAKLRRFVETGGFLVTTDWALRLATRAFPETIRRGGRDTGNDVVPVEVLDQDHPFLHNVQATDDTLRWWLESASYPIRVVDPRRVEVLLSSDVMRRRYGQAAIAVTFVEGEGRVLHTTSHFYLQQSRLSSARDRARGSAFARDLGLSDDDVEELRGRGLDDVRVGHVAGAFAMQQLISNVVITKRRENDLLLSHFQLRATGEGELMSTRDGEGESTGTIKSGFLLRELETRGEMVRVRDLFGREGWVAESLIRRPEPPPEPEPEVVDEAPTDTLDAEAAPIPVAPAAETADAGCTTSGLDGAPGVALLVLAAFFATAGRRQRRRQ
jgi:MYXO-CTERM domain-containing protein